MRIFHPVYSKLHATHFIPDPSLIKREDDGVEVDTAPLIFGPVNLMELAKESDVISSGLLDPNLPLDEVKLVDLVVKHKGSIKTVSLNTELACGRRYFDHEPRKFTLDGDAFTVSLSFTVHTNGELLAGYSIGQSEEDAPVEVLGYTMEFTQKEEVKKATHKE